MCRLIKYVSHAMNNKDHCKALNDVLICSKQNTRVTPLLDKGLSKSSPCRPENFRSSNMVLASLERQVFLSSSFMPAC